MTSLSGISHPTPPISQQCAPERLVRAAHQFESILLNQLLGSLEHAFSALGKEKNEPASDHYHFLGMQALTSSIAAQGGIGIADMIIRGLRQPYSHELDPLVKQQKSLSHFSSERLPLNF